METITRKYRVYSFKELKEDAQDKAVERFCEINVDYDWWESDYLLDNYLSKAIRTLLKAKMLKTGKKSETLFTWDNIFFSIDRANYLEFKNLQVTNYDVFFRFLKLPQKYWDDVDISFDFEGRESNTIISIEYPEEQLKNQEKYEAKFNDLVEKALDGLRKLYEELMSREAVIETIEANEYRFLKDGTVFH